MLPLQRIDDFAYGPAGRMDLALIAGAIAQRDRNAYGDTRMLRIVHVAPHGNDGSQNEWEVGTKSIVPRSSVERQPSFSSHFGRVQLLDLSAFGLAYSQQERQSLASILPTSQAEQS